MINKITIGALSFLAMVSVGFVAAIEARPLKGCTVAYQTLDAADGICQFKIFLRQARSGDPHSQRVTASRHDMGLGAKKEGG